MADRDEIVREDSDEDGAYPLSGADEVSSDPREKRRPKRNGTLVTEVDDDSDEVECVDEDSGDNFDSSGSRKRKHPGDLDNLDDYESQNRKRIKPTYSRAVCFIGRFSCFFRHPTFPLYFLKNSKRFKISLLHKKSKYGPKLTELVINDIIGDLLGLDTLQKSVG